MVKRVVLATVLVVFCSFGIAGAGWLSDAVERTKKRAVDDAVDATYDTTKEKLTVKSDDEEAPPRETVRPGKRQAKPSREAASAPQGDDDEHFIQPDDFFISEDAMGSRAWIHVRLAKMVTPPTPKTKGQAEFFRIHDGKNIWTKYYWRTRMATEEDVKLGVTVVMIDGRSEDGVYLPPENKEEARGHNWFMAKITDTSDLYRNYVTVSGNYKVDVKSLRVFDKQN